MNVLELSVLALGLSMDAFAVALCIGLTVRKLTIYKMLVVGLYFGIFQAAMPLIGYLLANQFAEGVVAYSSWIAFALLTFLGIKMIIGSFKKEGDDSSEASLGPKKMLPLAFATSVDALAVGVPLAFFDTNILPAVALIGAVTLIVCIVAVRVGHMFGMRMKSKAEVFGGIILVGMGVYVLIF